VAKIRVIHVVRRQLRVFYLKSTPNYQLPTPNSRGEVSPSLQTYGFPLPPQRGTAPATPPMANPSCGVRSRSRGAARAHRRGVACKAPATSPGFRRFFLIDGLVRRQPRAFMSLISYLLYPFDSSRNSFLYLLI